MADNEEPEKPGEGLRLLAGKPAEGCRDAPAASAPELLPEWLDRFDRSQAGTIDVRPILAAGQEPFNAVMGMLPSVPAGGGVIIDAPFNPLPLRRVLGRRGFSTYGEKLSEKHWRIWCRRELPPVGAERAATDAGGAAVWVEADGVHIDVRGLPAPVPLVAILGLIESGRHHDVMIVHHEREPLFLFPELAERGWTHAIVAGEAGEVRLVLRREPD